MPEGKADYMTLNISKAEARAEPAFLRTHMHQKGCTCKSSTYQQISDRLCKALAYIQYKTNLEKYWPGKQSSLQPSLTPETPDLDHPQPRGPFLRAKIIKSYVYLSVFCIPTDKFLLYNFPYFLLGYLSSIPSPKHSQCLKPLQYLSWPVLEFFFVITVLFAWWGTVLYRPGQLKIGSPVRISLGQITGFCLCESVQD